MFIRSKIVTFDRKESSIVHNVLSFDACSDSLASGTADKAVGDVIGKAVTALNIYMISDMPICWMTL